jgi:hypothetical protein
MCPSCDLRPREPALSEAEGSPGFSRVFATTTAAKEAKVAKISARSGWFGLFWWVSATKSTGASTFYSFAHDLY